LLASPWPVHALWLYNTQDGAPKPVAAAQSVLITRIGYDPTPHLLPDGAAAFISALQAGQSLGDAAESAPDFDLSATLGLLLSTESIVKLIYEEDR
jgi:hypothetical protein